MGLFWGGFVFLAFAGTIHASNLCEEKWNPKSQNCVAKYKLDAAETCTYECSNEANKDQIFFLKFNVQPDYLTIECPDHIKSFDFIVKNVKLLQDVKKVTWKNCPLPAKKSLGSLFQQLGLTNAFSFSIENDFDMNPKAEHFQGLNQIREFNWISSHLLDFDPKIAESLSGLLSFKIRARHVELTRDFLAHFKNLEKLAISYSETLSVEAQALDELKVLTDLEVLFQRVTSSNFEIRNMMNSLSLPQLRLGPNNAVKRFTFTGSKVKEIPDDFFANCQNLEYIDMSNNLITKLSEKTLSGLTSLQTLNLNINQIEGIHEKAFKNLPSLKDVFLSRNKIVLDASLPRSPFAESPSIVKLDLSSNQISKIFPDWLHVMKNLELLDISNNNIPSLQSSDVAFAQNRITVNLKFNKIAAIDFAYVKNEEKPIYGPNSGHVNIVLDKNPIECRKDSKAFKDFAQFLQGKLFIAGVNQIQMDPQQITCQRSDGQVIKIADFFQCPDSCDCTESAAEQIYSIDCSSKGLKLAPNELPVIQNFVTKLNLDSNFLTQLPFKDQKGYDAVTEMSAAYNQIPEFSSENILPKLQSLSLEGNPLTTIYADSTLFPFLENLFFDHNVVTTAYFNFVSNSPDGVLSVSEGIKDFLDQVKNLNTLVIRSLRSDVIPLEALSKGTNLVSINLAGIKFQNIPRNAFEFAKNLKDITIYFEEKKEDIVGPVSTLDESLFLNNKNLENIVISNIPRLSSIPEKIFSSLQNLKTVSLVNNGIESLPDKLFENNLELGMIDFSDNQLTSISRALLSKLSKLEVFRMNHNNLQSVHESSFVNLPILKEIDLSFNQLTFNEHLGPSPFFKNKQLVRLELSHNKIPLIFSDWRISLPELQELDLSYNLLPEITSSDLQFQQINEINVNLGWNQIRTVRLSYVKAAPGHKEGPIAYIDLQNNPMQCDCSAASFARYLSGESTLKNHDEYRQVEIAHENLLCDGPSDFVQNKKVSEFVGADIGCYDPTEHCPDLCSCSLNEDLHQYVIDCSYLNLTKAPAKLDPSPDYSVVLILTGNLLTELPLKSQPGYEFVVDFQVANNNIGKVTEENWLPKLKSIEIRNNSITSLTSNLVLSWFYNPLQKLEFDRSKITHIELNTCEENGFKVEEQDRLALFVQALEGMSNLEELYLTCAHIEINRAFFKAIQKLKRFTLLQNRLSVIDTGAFNDLHDLEKLTLSFKNSSETSISLFYNSLSLLKNLFHYNVRLQEISFTNITHFGIIHKEVFYRLNDLRKLTFSWNSVQNLPELMFKFNSNLVFLDLSHNSLQHISKYILFGLKNLKELYLNDNQLIAIDDDAFDNLRNLEVVDLSGNELSTVSFSSPTIQRLFLSHNIFSQLDSRWKTLPNLEYLDLSFNNLEKLENSDVQFNLRNVVVDVKGNQINKLSFTYEDAAAGKPEAFTTSIIFQDNRLVCDCATANFATYLKGLKRIGVSNNVHFVNYESLKCNQNLDEPSVGDLIYQIDPKAIGC